jgi:uncharacterized low-complexity protein
MRFDNQSGDFQMAKFNKLNPLAATLGAAVVASVMSAPVMAAENPFAAKELSGGYMQLAGDHGKGAEGKCGEGKCGEGKCGEGKCGEGKCGGDKDGDKGDKGGEGKCGEGKCGG